MEKWAKFRVSVTKDLHSDFFLGLFQFAQKVFGAQITCMCKLLVCAFLGTSKETICNYHWEVGWLPNSRASFQSYQCLNGKQKEYIFLTFNVTFESKWK